MEKTKKQILVAEDDKFLRKVYQVKLAKEGFDVIIAKDGEEALKMALQNKPYLILLDMVMPKMSGFDVLEAIRANKDTQKTKVIILSNLGQDSDIQKGKELGVLEYVVKSNTNLEDVISIIRKHLK
ncbi:MAG: response regulator [Patescibacteria group bacterium]